MNAPPDAGTRVIVRCREVGTAELAASVQRWRPSGHDDLAAAYEAGEVKTQAARAVCPPHASRFTPRKCRKRAPGEWEARRDRRRLLGGSGVLPATLRHHYTEGERSVLCVVGGEVKRQGYCDLTIQEIGDRAGVGRTTVQNALHEARLLGHVTIQERPRQGRKSDSNVVRIVSREWVDWLRRAPSVTRLIGSTLPKMVNPSKNSIILSGKRFLNAPDSARCERAKRSGEEERDL